MMLDVNNLASADDTNNLHTERQLAPLQAEYEALFAAPTDAVFEAVVDHERFCQLVPSLQHVTLYHSKQGLIRQCDFGNDMIVEQRIVQCKPPSVFAYAITTPNPLGVRQHYAIATCNPYENGTHLCCQHYFEHDDLAAMLAMLNTMFGYLIDGLVEEFGGHRL